MSQQDSNVKTSPASLSELAQRTLKRSAASDDIMGVSGDALSVATHAFPGVYLGRIAGAAGVPPILAKAIAPAYATGRGLWRSAQARERGAMGLAPQPLSEKDLINAAVEGALNTATWSGLGMATGANVTPKGLGKSFMLNAGLSMSDRVARYLSQKAAFNKHYERAFTPPVALPEPVKESSALPALIHGANIGFDLHDARNEARKGPSSTALRRAAFPLLMAGMSTHLLYKELNNDKKPPKAPDEALGKTSTPRKPVKDTPEAQRQHDKSVAAKAALRLDGSSLVREGNRIYKVPASGRRTLLVESPDLDRIWFLAREEISRLRRAKNMEAKALMEADAHKTSSLSTDLISPDPSPASMKQLAEATISPMQQSLPTYAAGQQRSRNKFSGACPAPMTLENKIRSLVKGSAPTRTFGSTPSGSMAGKRPGNTEGSISRPKSQGGMATAGGPSGSRPTGSPLSNQGVGGVVRQAARSATAPSKPAATMSSSAPAPATAFSSGGAPAAPMATIPKTLAPRPPKIEKPVDTTPKTPEVPKISSFYGLLQAGPLIGAGIGAMMGNRSYAQMAQRSRWGRTAPMPSKPAHLIQSAATGAGIGWLPQLSVDGVRGIEDFLGGGQKKESSFANAARSIGQHYANKMRYMGQQLRTPFAHADAGLQRLVSTPEALFSAWASAPKRLGNMGRGYTAGVATGMMNPLDIAGWQWLQGKAPIIRQKFGLLDPRQWMGGADNLMDTIGGLPLEEVLTPGPTLAAGLVGGGLSLAGAQGMRQAAKIGVGDVAAHSLARMTGAPHHVAPAAMSPVQRIMSGQSAPSGLLTELSMVQRTGAGSQYGKNRSAYLGGELKRASELQNSGSWWDRLVGRSIERNVTGQKWWNPYNANATQDLLAYYGGGGDKYLRRFQEKTHFLNRGLNRRWANRMMDYYDTHNMPIPRRPGQSTGPMAEQWATFRKGDDALERSQAAGSLMDVYEKNVNTRLGEMGSIGNFIQRHASKALAVPRQTMDMMANAAPNRAARPPSALPALQPQAAAPAQRQWPASMPPIPEAARRQAVNPQPVQRQWPASMPPIPPEALAQKTSAGLLDRVAKMFRRVSPYADDSLAVASLAQQAGPRIRRTVVDAIHGPLEPETLISRRDMIGRMLTASKAGTAYHLATNPAARAAVGHQMPLAGSLMDQTQGVVNRVTAAARQPAQAAPDMTRRSFLGIDRAKRAVQQSAQRLQSAPNPRGSQQAARDINMTPVSRRELLGVDSAKRGVEAVQNQRIGERIQAQEVPGVVATTAFASRHGRPGGMNSYLNFSDAVQQTGHIAGGQNLYNRSVAQGDFSLATRGDINSRILSRVRDNRKQGHDVITSGQRALADTAPEIEASKTEALKARQALNVAGAVPGMPGSDIFSPLGNLIMKQSEDAKAAQKVGIFIPLPGYLERFFYAKNPVDPSPAHVTMVYVGEVPKGRGGELERIVREVLANVPAGNVHMGGVGRFPEGYAGVPHYMHVKVYDELAKARDQIVMRLIEAGFELKAKDAFEWKPHCTLAYLPAEEVYRGPETIGSFRVPHVEIWGLGAPRRIQLQEMSMTKVSSRAFIQGARSALTWPLRASPMTTLALGTGVAAYGVKKAVGDPMTQAAKSWKATQRPEFMDLYTTFRHGSGANQRFDHSPLYVQRPSRPQMA